MMTRAFALARSVSNQRRYAVQCVEQEMRMKLHLKSLEFTCSQRPLKIVFFHLLFSQSFKILIGMRRYHDGDVNRNLIGKSLVN